MQRLNRSAHAPLGTAFFLFVSLAIIPVSLKAAGLKVGFSPRLSAAIDIWRQVAEVFGPNYDAGTGSELAALFASDAEPANAAGDEACPLREYACDREVDESSPTLPEIQAAVVPTTDAQPAACFKAAPRNQLRTRPLGSGVAAVEISSSIEKSAQALKALSAERAEAALRVEVLKILEKCSVSRRSDLSDPTKNLGIPKSLRILVRFKQPAVTSMNGAECNVRTALAPAGRLRLERASLNTPPAAPDNCDL
jgi:hypothetical protein